MHRTLPLHPHVDGSEECGRFTRLGRLLAVLPLHMQGGTIDSHWLYAFPVVIRESSIWPFRCTTSTVGAYNEDM